MSRPPYVDPDDRAMVVSIRMPVYDRDTIRAAAETQRVSFSRFVAEAAVEEALRVLDTARESEREAK